MPAKKKTATEKSPFNPGKPIFGWEAHDYHPHNRGWIWISIFCLIIFGGAAWALWSGDWMMAFTFLIVAAIYFFFHRKGHETHQIGVFEKGIQIDQRFYDWKTFAGFWFVYDETQQVAVVNLQLAEKDDKIMLQMGELIPDELRAVFAKVELPELTEKKEGLVDLWVRALKL